MAVASSTNDFLREYYGLSSDTKPINEFISSGSVFVEEDTLEVYFFDAPSQQWFLAGTEPSSN